MCSFSSIFSYLFSTNCYRTKITDWFTLQISKMVQCKSVFLLRLECIDFIVIRKVVKHLTLRLGGVGIGSD